MNCIIVDDEPLAREAIEALVLRHGGLTVAGQFNSARAAAEFMARNAVDLVFLDIRMPGMTGLELARMIPRTTLVIFTTAFGKYAVESYEVEAVDYLVKPVEQARFDKAVDKAIGYHALLVSEEQPGDAPDFVFVRSERRYVRVDFRDVLFVEGLKDYVIFQRTGDRVITKMTMKAVEELLPQGFIRVNRSYIVNRDRIDSLDANDIFIGSHEIPIGESYRDAVFPSVIPNL